MTITKWEDFKRFMDYNWDVIVAFVGVGLFVALIICAVTFGVAYEEVSVTLLNGEVIQAARIGQNKTYLVIVQDGRRKEIPLVAIKYVERLPAMTTAAIQGQK